MSLPWVGEEEVEAGEEDEIEDAWPRHRRWPGAVEDLDAADEDV